MTRANAVDLIPVVFARLNAPVSIVMFCFEYIGTHTEKAREREERGERRERREKGHKAYSNVRKQRQTIMQLGHEVTRSRYPHAGFKVCPE